MKGRRRALSVEYLHPGSGALRGGVSRQVLAMVILTVAILFGGKALDVLGSERDVLQWVVGILVLSGATAGALYHPVRRFWWRGALAGIVATGSAFMLSRKCPPRSAPLGP
jgi:hypothetical protein